MAVARVRVARGRRRSSTNQTESDDPSSAREGRGALSDRVRPAPRAYLTAVTMDPRSAWAVLHEVTKEDGAPQVDRRSNLARPKMRDGRSPARGPAAAGRAAWWGREGRHRSHRARSTQRPKGPGRIRSHATLCRICPRTWSQVDGRALEHAHVTCTCTCTCTTCTCTCVTCTTCTCT